MPYCLSIDLSASEGSLAVHTADERCALVAEISLGPGFKHSEKLISSLEKMLSEKKLALASMDRFVGTWGPGSFTGLRIALSTLKAFAVGTGKPIELMSGSEARAIAWRLEDSSPAPQVIVYTHVSLDKYVRAVFKAQGDRLVPQPEEVVTLSSPTSSETGILLLDERTRPELFPRAATRLFPLRARHLGRSLSLAITRQTLSTPAEWIAASPKYFGDTKF